MIFLAEVSDAGKYMVRAVNDGGEAQSIANFVFVDQTQIESSSLQVEIQKEVSNFISIFMGCNVVQNWLWLISQINILFSFKQKSRFT